MKFTRLFLPLVLLLLIASPAVADLGMDLRCKTAGTSMQALTKQCGVAGGTIAGADARLCVEAHASELAQTASVCVYAAQNHYAAAHDLSGYDADRELIGGATFLGIAAEANVYLERRDLATAQLKSVITMTTQVASDPLAANLTGMAYSEQAVAYSLLHSLAAR